jgi:MFS family permease
MLIILLQGIWLPLHGYSYSTTPFWSGVFLVPMLIGFVILGPIGGRFSDRHGARLFSTLGMVISAAALIGLSLLPFNFAFTEFAVILLIFGIGAGMFASPNTAAIMNSVPPQDRGVGSGMRATLQNVGQTASLAIFFTIVLDALSTGLPGAISTALTKAGASQLIPAFQHVSPTSALFAAFLGYNPVQSILSTLQPSVVASIPAATKALLVSNTFFPNAIEPAFISALRVAFYIGAILSLIAAVTSALRGPAKPAQRAVPKQEAPQAVPAITRAADSDATQGRPHASETAK